MGLVSFVISPELDYFLYLSIKSVLWSTARIRCLKVVRPTKTNQGRLKRDSNFKVLICLLGPGPGFFVVFFSGLGCVCVSRFSSWPWKASSLKYWT